jgi:LysM repeat protein
MKLHHHFGKAFVLLMLSLLIVTPSFAQQETTAPPSQIDLAIGALSQGLRENITLDDLASYEWSRQEFSDASLGCPRSGQMYAQVITTGYQFLLTYEGTTYDYRVSEDGETVVWCDSRPSMPTDPTPTQEPPTSSCDEQYTVQSGDTLIEIAQACNSSVAALLNANPEIEDPSLIYTGQTLVIPEGGVERLVSIRPNSGPPGTMVRIFASGFPPGAQVQLGFGPPESEYEVLATREIGDDGELVADLQISPQIEPPNERVAVVVLNGEETISEVFTVTEGQVNPVPTPTEPADGEITQTQIYLVAIGDEGQSGEAIGCGDSLVPVTVTFDPTPAPLTAALEQLFAIDSRTYGQSGLYNALYQSDLAVEGIDIRNGEASINLSGTLRVGGVCDEPRVIAQLEQTALQYSTIDSVSISLNGEPLETSF